MGLWPWVKGRGRGRRPRKRMVGGVNQRKEFVDDGASCEECSRMGIKRDGTVNGCSCLPPLHKGHASLP